MKFENLNKAMRMMAMTMTARMPNRSNDNDDEYDFDIFTIIMKLFSIYQIYFHKGATI